MITRLGGTYLRSPFQRRRRSRENGFRRETSLQSDSESEQKRTFTRICVDFRHPVVLFSLPYSWRGESERSAVVRLCMYALCVARCLKIIYLPSRIYRNFMRDYKIPLIIHIYHKYICKRYIISDRQAFISVAFTVFKLGGQSSWFCIDENRKFPQFLKFVLWS